MKRMIGIIIFLLSILVGLPAYAQQFQFAPDRTTTQTTTTTTKPSQKTQQQTTTTAQTTAAGSGLEAQLSIISDWEETIVKNIPQPIKDKVNALDEYRQELARKYEKLSATASKDATVAIKGKPAQGTLAVSYDAGPGYYWYTALAFFFGKMYLFYGAILIGTFLVLRIILRYFNVIV